MPLPLSLFHGRPMSGCSRLKTNRRENFMRPKRCAAAGACANSIARSIRSSTSAPRFHGTKRKCSPKAPRPKRRRDHAGRRNQRSICARVSRAQGRILRVRHRTSADSASRAVSFGAWWRFCLYRATTPAPHRRRMVSDRSTLFSSQAPLPRRHRSQARQVHSCRRRPDAHVSELRA